MGQYVLCPDSQFFGCGASVSLYDYTYQESVQTISKTNIPLSEVCVFSIFDTSYNDKSKIRLLGQEGESEDFETGVFILDLVHNTQEFVGTLNEGQS